MDASPGRPIGLEELRAQVRAWAAEHIPVGWRKAMTDVDDDEYVAFQRSWLATLRSGGYAVPHWPADWEGGFSVAQQAVIAEELARAGAPRLASHFVALNHAAAALEAALPDLRDEFLPGILEGEIWCQGFSEPGAGSDLASLRTSAIRRGDVYVIRGQKIWSSYAKFARWCLLLARTDPAAPKRKGISYFVLDLRSAGVDVRQIRNANGENDFCEIFLDDVEIPVSRRIGAENDGWRVAQSTLVAERGVTMVELQIGLDIQLRRLAGEMARFDDPDLQLLGLLAAEVRALQLLVNQTVDAIAAGSSAPAASALLKLLYSELLQRISDAGLQLAGMSGHDIALKPRGAGWHGGPWMVDFVGSWEWTIGGGTNEILRNVIAERLLGLPREPELVIT